MGRTATVVLIAAVPALSVVLGMARCPVAHYLHVPCPGCGTTRAARALLHLDVPAALRANPVAPLTIVLLAAFFARVVWLVATDGTLARMSDGAIDRWLVRGLFAVMALQIVVWALRFFGLFGGPVPV